MSKFVGLKVLSFWESSFCWHIECLYNENHEGISKNIGMYCTFWKILVWKTCREWNQLLWIKVLMSVSYSCGIVSVVNLMYLFDIKKIKKLMYLCFERSCSCSTSSSTVLFIPFSHYFLIYISGSVCSPATYIYVMYVCWRFLLLTDANTIFKQEGATLGKESWVVLAAVKMMISIDLLMEEVHTRWKIQLVIGHGWFPYI